MMNDPTECFVAIEDDGSDHNPRSEVMRSCLQMECELTNTVDFIAGLRAPSKRALAAWELVFGILSDNSLHGLRVAIDRAWEVFSVEYNTPEHLEDCLDGTRVLPVKDCDRIENEPVEQMLLEIACLPNRVVRKQLLNSVVACARQEPTWEVWADTVAWFVRQAPGRVPLFTDVETCANCVGAAGEPKSPAEFDHPSNVVSGAIH